MNFTPITKIPSAYSALYLRLLDPEWFDDDSIIRLSLILSSPPVACVYWEGDGRPLINAMVLHDKTASDPRPHAVLTFADNMADFDTLQAFGVPGINTKELERHFSFSEKQLWGIEDEHGRMSGYFVDDGSFYNINLISRTQLK